MLNKNTDIGKIYNLTCNNFLYISIDINNNYKNLIQIKNTDHLVFLEYLGFVKKQIFPSTKFYYFKFFIMEHNIITYLVLSKEYYKYYKYYSNKFLNEVI